MFRNFQIHISELFHNTNADFTEHLCTGNVVCNPSDGCRAVKLKLVYFNMQPNALLRICSPCVYIHTSSSSFVLCDDE